MNETESISRAAVTRIREAIELVDQALIKSRQARISLEAGDETYEREIDKLGTVAERLDRQSELLRTTLALLST